MKRLISFAIILSLTGCMVGPNYQTPEICLVDQWSTPTDANDLTPLTEWWTVFNDPLLNKYIQSAAVANKNVLVAEANILQARALRQVSVAALYPHIGADLNAAEFKFSRNGLIFGQTPDGPNPEARSLYNVLFDAVWELDLFGKNRRSIEAANATIESNIEERNNVLLSVMAEMARTYIEVRSYQKKKELTEANIAVLEQQLAIVRKQLEFGYVNLLDYDEVEADLANAKAALPDITAEIYRNIYTLSVLTGEMPETLLGELLEVKPLPRIPETVAVGLRSDLLRRRPDIRRVERQLASATATIGVAVASFFPTIILGAVGGLQSLHLNNLFTGASNIWGVGGDASVPLFQGGKIIGNLHVNQAAAQVAYQTYQQTVLQALEETESALSAFTQEKLSESEYLQAAKKYRSLSQLAYMRYEKGLTNRIDFLNSEKQFLTAEQNLLQSQTLALVDLIALYKALGGGWQPNLCVVDNLN